MANSALLEFPFFAVAEYLWSHGIYCVCYGGARFCNMPDSIHE